MEICQNFHCLKIECNFTNFKNMLFDVHKFRTNTNICFLLHNCGSRRWVAGGSQVGHSCVADGSLRAGGSHAADENKNNKNVNDLAPDQPPSNVPRDVMSRSPPSL